MGEELQHIIANSFSRGQSVTKKECTVLKIKIFPGAADCKLPLLTKKLNSVFYLGETPQVFASRWLFV
jgi:hypothetical protein